MNYDLSYIFKTCLLYSFQVPERMWDYPTSLPVEGFISVYYYCEALMGNQKLLRYLKQEQFDLAIVDLLYNECGVALAHHLGDYLIR